MEYCLKCCTPSSRPRVILKDNTCNACEWHEKKKTLDWSKRFKVLEDLCAEQIKLKGKKSYNCIVPVSGGKDGSYVAWKMKYELGMNPLCVTFSPPMQTELGRRNLENFRDSGFDVMEIRPNPKVYAQLCKLMFIEQARSKFPFVIGIATAVAKVAAQMDIPLVIYGEEGETEYSGKRGLEDVYLATPKFVREIYHEGNVIKDYQDKFSLSDLYWWIPPGPRDMKKLKITWWSKFESWDDQLHRDLAIEKCGLEGSKQTGTFTTHSQVDDILQDLHAYECFLKYGFGRATGDCNLAIHGGRMTREEAVRIVNRKDGEFPLQYLLEYQKFFQMSENEFWGVINKFANKELLKPTGNPERPWVLKELIK